MNDQTMTMPAMKEAMRKTKSQPAIETDSVHLAAEKHAAGEACLYMVINAHDKLPKIGEKERYWLYNYAPLEATFTLKGVGKDRFVYCFEGADWKKVSRVKDYDKPQKGAFEPGEMKLYLVLPREPNIPWSTSSSSNSVTLAFTLGAFGGHGGRALLAGDVLRLVGKQEQDRCGDFLGFGHSGAERNARHDGAAFCLGIWECREPLLIERCVYLGRNDCVHANCVGQEFEGPLAG